MLPAAVRVGQAAAPALLLHGDKDDGVPIEHSLNIQAEYRKNNVTCELEVIKGAGHGFFGREYARHADDAPRHVVREDAVQAPTQTRDQAPPEERPAPMRQSS